MRLPPARCHSGETAAGAPPRDEPTGQRAPGAAHLLVVRDRGSRRATNSLTIAFHAEHAARRSGRSTWPSLWFLDATVPVTVAAATSSPPTSIYHGRNLPGTRKDAGQCAYYAGSRHHVGGFARFEMVLSRKCWPRVQSRAPSRPKTKAMASPINLTVALDSCVGKRMVKLCGGRWTGRSADSSTAGNKACRGRRALPVCRAATRLPCTAVVVVVGAPDGCARWLSVSCGAELSCAGRSR